MDVCLETTNCILCGSASYSLWLRTWNKNDPKQIFNIVSCNGCGLKFTNPRPIFEHIGAFYGENYYSYRRPVGSAGRAKKLPGLKPRFLDYGCGAGHKLIEKINAGYEAFGVEINEQARLTGRGLGLDIREAQRDKIDFESNYFDEIHINNVLEHLHNPSAIMAEIYRCLKSGGRLWVEVPNVESYDAKLYGAFWRHLDVPRHLTHFSPQSLSRLLRQSGFRDFRMTTNDIPVLSINSYYVKGLFTILKTKFRIDDNSHAVVRFCKSLWFVLSRFGKYIFHHKTENNGALLQVVALKSCHLLEEEQHWLAVPCLSK